MDVLISCMDVVEREPRAQPYSAYRHLTDTCENLLSCGTHVTYRKSSIHNEKHSEDAGLAQTSQSQDELREINLTWLVERVR